MQRNYFFADDLVVRVPGYSFRSQFDESFIAHCCSDDFFMEALYLASPDLYDESVKWKNGKLNSPKKLEKLIHSLVKYYGRLSSRCTPFGLFAGCSVTRWGEAAPLVVAADGYSRHTRLDMQYLCALSQAVAALPAVRRQLRFTPNTSLYRVGGEVRFMENSQGNGGAGPQISSVSLSEYLLQVLRVSEAGLRIDQIAARLTGEHIDFEQARQFVEEVIDAQLLVSELAPTVTGPDYFVRMLQVLRRVQAEAPDGETEAVLHVLTDVEARLAALDRAGVNGTEQYEHIAWALSVLGVPFERNKLFNVSLSTPVLKGALDRQLQASIGEALEVLNYLAPDWKSESLESFKAEFLKRYEGREMPLLEVLDSENGIGYAGKGKGGYTPLTEDLVLPDTQTGHTVSWGEPQQLLFGKLREMLRRGSYELALSREDVAHFRNGAMQQLPPSLSVMFHLADPHTVVLEAVGGSSAVNLLGRFAYADPGIHAVARDISRRESEANPDFLFAEIVHLPESRVGNILLRPVLRDFEIPYLAQAALPPEGQIPPGDLVVCVQNDTVMLRSKKHNKWVMPRLSTAHNYASRSLPVYQFLCDLQSQGLQASLGFNWDAVFPEASFLPRLTYQNVVLHLATWQLQRPDFQGVADAADEALPAAFAAFQRKWQLPRFFALTEGDNELLVDSENPLTLKTWAAAIRGRDTIRLKEFLFNAGAGIVRDAQDRPYVHQFIASFLRKDACYAGAKVVVPAGEQDVQREFWPGSEWLYYKLYCGINAADQILVEAIRPAADELLASRFIDKWFFVRFADPDNHLRVRFHLNHPALIGEALRIINQHLLPYLTNGYIWKNQVDTYTRELERYGYPSMEITETLFFLDSTAAVQLLEQIGREEREQVLWLCGIKSADELLNAFDCPLPEKWQLMQQMRNAFAQEFKVDKGLKLQLDTKYRAHRATINEVLTPAPDTAYASLFKPVYTRNERMKSVVDQVRGLQQQNRLGLHLDNLLSSYVHMSINRLISTDQRLHEMVIYDFLERKYRTEIAMQPKGG